MNHDFSHIRTTSVRGKTWRVFWRRPRGKKMQGCVGSCDPPGNTEKRMFIEPDDDALEMVGTLLHECAHAAFPDVTEDVIEDYERDVLRLLRRMGARIVFEPK